MASGGDVPDPNKPKALAKTLKTTNGKKPPKVVEKPKAKKPKAIAK
jgi:hypothetical protein